MRRQSLIALVVAVLLGLVAVYIANTWFSAREAQLDRADQPMARVAVAAVELGYGAEVTPDRVRFVDYPTASLPQGHYTSLEELLPEGEKRHVLRPISVNQLLLASDMTGAGEGASIAATLPDGMRATTVRINAVSGVAGFIKPNDTVDVLITRQPINGGGQQVTDVLLQNVRVIAMDQDAQGQNERPNVSSTATLEVTPVDAQKLVLGQQLGSLSLTLRKPGVDQNIGRVETVSLDDLRYELSSGQLSPGAPSQAAPTAAPRPRQTVRRTTPRPTAPTRPANPQVEVVRQTQSSNYQVGDYDQ